MPKFWHLKHQIDPSVSLNIFFIFFNFSGGCEGGFCGGPGGRFGGGGFGGGYPGWC